MRGEVKQPVPSRNCGLEITHEIATLTHAAVGGKGLFAIDQPWFSNKEILSGARNEKKRGCNPS